MGVYGIEYYFDYPALGPIARFILHSDGIAGEVSYDYSLGTVHYNFVASAIDTARSKGIPWVIIGSHKGCAYAGDNSGCDWNPDLWNLVFTKRVDLILYGHAHIYGRSHHLTCATIGSTNPACIVDTDNNFAKGAGRVINLIGVGGHNPRDLASAPESGYYATRMDTDSGFTKFTVSAERIDASFVSSTGSFTDNWSIGETAPPPPSLAADFTYTIDQASRTVDFTALATGGTAPYSFNWNFGDGTTATGPTALRTFSSPGDYTVSLTVRDNFSNMASRSRLVTVGSEPPPPNSFALTWEGYDYDNAEEVTVRLNNQLLARVPPTSDTANHASWAPFSLDLSDLILQGTNNLVFTQEAGYSSRLKNVKVIAGPQVLLDEPLDTEMPGASTASFVFQVAQPPTPPQAVPTIVGWGGIRLEEVITFDSTNPPSNVFPGEQASNQEMQARKLSEMGYNAIRVSFQSACTSWQEMGPYNPGWLASSIAVARYYDMWLIIDYHGFTDLADSASSDCWLSFWNQIVKELKDSYEKIVWEPINEPTGFGDNVVHLSEQYQTWIDQARVTGDTHWIVVQNLCSYSCGFDKMADGFPTVTDPQDKVFVSLHTYMGYAQHSSSWNNATAEALALEYFQAVLEGSTRTGWPMLNTEGGADELCDKCAPDAILSGSAGYTLTTLHFIQTLTSLYDSHKPQRINWVWWTLGSWTDTPGAGLYGSLALDGWGSLLHYKKVAAPGILGDVNGDCMVNIIDAGLIAASYGKTVSDDGFYAAADVNSDGEVSTLDLNIAAYNYGKMCP